MEDRLLRKDGPWSLIVCAAAFISQVIGGGIQISGLYYVYFRSTFDASAVATSWLCSMSFVGWFLGSAVGGHIIKRFGYRVCALIGALISSLGFAMCMFAHNFYTLFFLYGILGCVGNGIQLCGFYTAVNFYFEKYVNSAQTFASVGVGIGVSIYSVVFTGFIEEYGWRGALLLQSGFSLNACVIAMLLFPRPLTGNTVRKTIRWSVILKLHVLLLCIHFYMAVITESMVYVHLPVLITSKGFSAKIASLSLLVFGVSNIVSRAIYSIPCKINVIFLYTMTMCTGGVLLVVLPFLRVLSSILVCLASAGFTFTVYGGMNLLVIRQTAQPDEFVDVAAIAFSFKTFGAVSAGPIAGLVFDMTEDYNYAFYMSGTIAVVACMFLIPSITAKSALCSRFENVNLDEIISFEVKSDSEKSTNVSSNV